MEVGAVADVPTNVIGQKLSVYALLDSPYRTKYMEIDWDLRGDAALLTSAPV